MERATYQDINSIIDFSISIKEAYFKAAELELNGLAFSDEYLKLIDVIEHAANEEVKKYYSLEYDHDNLSLFDELVSQKLGDLDLSRIKDIDNNIEYLRTHNIIASIFRSKNYFYTEDMFNNFVSRPRIKNDIDKEDYQTYLQNITGQNAFFAILYKLKKEKNEKLREYLTLYKYVHIYSDKYNEAKYLNILRNKRNYLKPINMDIIDFKVSECTVRELKQMKKNELFKNIVLTLTYYLTFYKSEELTEDQEIDLIYNLISTSGEILTLYSLDEVAKIKKEVERMIDDTVDKRVLEIINEMFEDVENILSKYSDNYNKVNTYIVKKELV